MAVAALPAVTLALAVGGLVGPLFAAHAGDDCLFVVE
jgi:hypothetical protein